MKECSSCAKQKCFNDFWKNGTRRHSKCKDCMRKRNKQPYSVEKHYVKSYGITLDEVKRRLINQHHLCALCSTSLDRFVIDHCHKTGQVRGILCYQCNTGLGFFNDSTDQLRIAIDYLEKFK